MAASSYSCKIFSVFKTSLKSFMSLSCCKCSANGNYVFTENNFAYKYVHNYACNPSEFKILKPFLPHDVPSASFSLAPNTSDKKLNQSQTKIKREQEKRRQEYARRKKLPLLETQNRLSVKEISELTGRTIAQVKAAIHLVAPTEKITAKTIVDDQKLVISILRKLGFRWKSKPVEKRDNVVKLEDVLPSMKVNESRLLPRPPIVTMLGHIDHGKTTLLDCLRHSAVADHEAGGITQRIGAFSLTLESGQSVTFLDAPGHAAFAEMRRRGAQLTDIVVLVVAADDGVMEQTIESIKMAREAGVAVVIAVNKCDKDRADPNAVLLELCNYGLVAESLDGDVQVVNISAKTGEGVDDLIESVAMEAELLKLRADKQARVQAVIVESRVDSHLGPITSAIVKQGTLKKGQYLVGGSCWARVKVMFDENRKRLQAAPPSTPVDIAGWKTLPGAGEEIIQVDDEAQAKKIVTIRNELQSRQDIEWEALEVGQLQKENRELYQQVRKKRLKKRERMYALHQTISDQVNSRDDLPQLNLVIKADVDGTLDVLLNVLNTYDCNEQVALKLVHSSVGPVTETDLDLADTCKARVFAFNVDPKPAIAQSAAERGIDIHCYDVIYHLVDRLIADLSDLLPLNKSYVSEGEATVKELFVIGAKSSNPTTILGCVVNTGQLNAKSTFVLERDGQVIREGGAASLRTGKISTDVVKAGSECGLCLTIGNDEEEEAQVGDRVRSCKVEMVRPKLKWKPAGF